MNWLGSLPYNGAMDIGEWRLKATPRIDGTDIVLSNGDDRLIHILTVQDGSGEDVNDTMRRMARQIFENS